MKNLTIKIVLSGICSNFAKIALKIKRTFQQTERIDLKEKLDFPKNDSLILSARIDRDSYSNDELTQAELAAYFNEPLEIPKPEDSLPTTQDGWKQWEHEQEWATTIHKIAARVKNLATFGGGQLTPNAEVLCNSYTHVLKSLYEWAENLPLGEQRESLINLIRSHENMPANVIRATKVGVKN